jgi:hypothetical protein
MPGVCHWAESWQDRFCAWGSHAQRTTPTIRVRRSATIGPRCFSRTRWNCFRRRRNAAASWLHNRQLPRKMLTPNERRSDEVPSINGGNDVLCCPQHHHVGHHCRCASGGLYFTVVRLR